MFSIKNLEVAIGDKEIIKGINLDIRPGEVHAIMGPNGAGKSSLASAIMGHPRYTVKGDVRLDGKNILEMSVDARVKAGLFLAFQHPQEIEGISVGKMLQKAVSDPNSKPDMKKMLAMNKEIQETAEKLGIGKEFTKRDLNVGFSGGEKKKSEILQMSILKPKMVILDEIDSGLDVDGLRHVAQSIEAMRDGKRAFLMITHYRRILDYVKPDFVHILVNGRIARAGDHRLAEEIDKKGYGEITKQG